MTTRPDVLLDITRLATRFSRTVPNGIDRVDHAFAAHFLSPRRAASGVVSWPRSARLIGTPAAAEVARAVSSHWREVAEGEADAELDAVVAELLGEPRKTRSKQANPGAAIGICSGFAGLARRGYFFGKNCLFPGQSVVRFASPGAIYLNISQFPVFHAPCFSWLDRRPDIKAVFFVHDLLPLELPEFFPPYEASLHRKRLDVIIDRASGLIVSGERTRNELARHYRESGRAMPPVLVLPLAVDNAFVKSAASASLPRLPPFFVVVGTIEPRKNHLILLNIWRELAAKHGPNCPKLVIAGVRGWENENVVDLIERSPLLAGHVLETSSLSTPALRSLLVASRGLLLPSFAEGFGLPVAEALALGVPVIAAEAPAAEAAGAHDLTILSPIDGLGWLEAIETRLKGRLSINRDVNGVRDGMPSDWACYFRHIEEFIADL